jgi:hypothetical protein
VLKAAFQLHNGIIEYARASGKVKTNAIEIESEKREMVRNHSPQLLSLYDATTDAAIKILEKLSSMDQTGIRLKVETFAVDSDKWTRDIINRNFS